VSTINNPPSPINKIAQINRLLQLNDLKSVKELLVLLLRYFPLDIVAGTNVTIEKDTNFSVYKITSTGSGTSILLQTNGTDNPVQTLLNLVAGTYMTITDDGAGNITFDASGGGGGTYTGDSGISENPANNFQFGSTTNTGSPLLHNTFLNLATFSLKLTSTVNSIPLSEVMSILGADIAIGDNSVSQNQNRLVILNSSNQTYLEGSTSGNKGLHLDYGNFTYKFGETQGNASATYFLINSLAGYFEFWGYDPLGSFVQRKAKLNGYTGQLTLDNYGIGTFVSTPIYSLGVDASGNVIEFTGGGGGTVTSVDLTMPAAFLVTGNPITTAGTLAVAAAGLSTQYIRGDGQLANFPTSTGGGSSVSYYLNGSINQGTLGGVAFKQMSGTPVIGAGTDFTINADGYIQSFITDASVPNQLAIPAGNWNFEMYFSANSNGGSPRFYIELYKLSAGTLTLIASSVANPEFITNGTQVDLYTTAVAVPSTVLLAADRLAIRVYVIHSSKTITLHTENSNLCQVITTFSTGLTALNGLTAQVQTFVNDTNVTIVSASTTHTITWAGILSIARGGTGLSALGTALQQIRVNAGGTALEYFTPTAVPSSFITYRRLVASATLDATDLTNVNTGAPYVVEMNVGSANNLTIPLNSSVAFTIGSQITISQYGAGQTTIVATGGVTLRSAGSFLKLAAQYSMCTLMKVGTDEWYVVGQLAP
jgi:hypothetical protein